MTNPTLERAARAADEYIEQCVAGALNDQEFTTGLARAVLMAVLADASALHDVGVAAGVLYVEGRPIAFSAEASLVAQIDAILNDGEGE